MAARRKKINTAALKALRYAKGMTQLEFWVKIGVTISGGSRFENSRRMPVPVALLVDLVHVRSIDTAKLKREDMAVLQFTEDNHPDLYEALLKGVCDTPQKTRHAPSPNGHRPLPRPCAASNDPSGAVITPTASAYYVAVHRNTFHGDLLHPN